MACLRRSGKGQPVFFQRRELRPARRRIRRGRPRPAPRTQERASPARRRQKVVLGNSFDNAQLEQAANANPIYNVSDNYDPKQASRFLDGNTAEETSALKEIAKRIVAQQLAAEPVPTALNITIPERGKVLTFHRSVQIDNDAPMLLTLDLKPARNRAPWLAVPLCLLLGGMVASRRRG